MRDERDSSTFIPHPSSLFQRWVFSLVCLEMSLDKPEELIEVAGNAREQIGGVFSAQ
jgi:hypothetical protein